MQIIADNKLHGLDIWSGGLPFVSTSKIGSTASLNIWSNGLPFVVIVGFSAAWTKNSNVIIGRAQT